MAAEIMEIERQAEEVVTSDLPTDAEAMSPEEVVEAFQGGDTTAPVQEEEELPEKYRGKSLKEIAAMHQEAEKLIGKHSSEVGELRQMVDGYIKTQLTPNQTVEQAPEEQIDFFEDPEKAVSQAIESHPAVQEAKQATVEQRRATSLAKLQDKHPDMDKVLSNPSFVEWVKASPVRVELFTRADQDYDFDCADELVSTFKERNAVAQQTVEAEQTARQQQVKAAQTGAASGANTSGAKRIYRRADIIKLMKTDPARYDAISGEILQAYAEGRVK